MMSHVLIYTSGLGIYGAPVPCLGVLGFSVPLTDSIAHGIHTSIQGLYSYVCHLDQETHTRMYIHTHTDTCSMAYIGVYKDYMTGCNCTCSMAYIRVYKDFESGDAYAYVRTRQRHSLSQAFLQSDGFGSVTVGFRIRRRIRLCTHYDI